MRLATLILTTGLLGLSAASFAHDGPFRHAEHHSYRGDAHILRVSDYHRDGLRHDQRQIVREHRVERRDAFRDHRAERRENNQERRIEHGVRRGDINPHEARRLDREQHRIDRIRDHARRDGHIDAREASHIEAAQNRANHHIARATHNGR